MDNLEKLSTQCSQCEQQSNTRWTPSHATNVNKTIINGRETYCTYTVLVILLGLIDFLAPKLLNYLAFQSVDYEHYIKYIRPLLLLVMAIAKILLAFTS